jgi:hypothetical protein
MKSPRKGGVAAINAMDCAGNDFPRDKAKMVAPASQSLLVTPQGSWCAVHLGNIGTISLAGRNRFVECTTFR